ncbi:MAG: TonB-dependent receptor [Cytophagaceae bacterium]|nr:TonB-dependent receptor [Cytophagaceae bacterium]|tara:strand:- start:116 stop:2908 length:2793 start_codon:yes stop_codon:yes gene_type:complete
MKYFYLFLLIIVSTTTIASAQQFSIQGRLLDAQDKTPLEAATVFAETVTDSTMITYTISKADGSFELTGRTGYKSVKVYVSFVGYKPFEKEVSLSSNRDLALGDIPLELQVESLGDVIIKARRPPVVIKKDTLEFNADSFKTTQGANLEDLLKELPGVEVDASGQITINGKAVNEILVNGKPFFSGDPTITTRTLTKEMIDKIQVSDTKTKTQAFTGDDGDDQNKSINITIKKERSRGVFGRATAGGGTDDRFEYAGMFNYFDLSSGLQVSALGAGNNINSPGFSFGEIEKMFGGARYMSVNGNGSFNINGRNFGGGDGIVNSRTAGANFADDWGKNTEASADYFYSASNDFNERFSQRENILPTNRYFSESSSTSVGNSDNHAVNARFETKKDTTWFIELRPSFNYTQGFSRSSNMEETRNEDRDLTNESMDDNNSFRTGRNFKNELNITRRYGNNRGYVRVGVDNEVNNTSSDSYLNSSTQVYGDDPELIERDQYTDGIQGVTSYNINAQWRIPIMSDKLSLNLEYRFGNSRREDKQSVYDFDDGASAYDDFNIIQSTDFTNTNRISRPEVGLQYRDREKNWNLSFNTGFVSRKLSSDDALRDIQFENNFNAVEINARVNKRFGQKTGLWSGYSLRNNAPGVRQLSPYVDVSNPLNTVTGNPDLEPETNHSLYLGFNNFDWQTRTGFNLHLNGNWNENTVVGRSIIDTTTFKRTTTYANVNGNYSLGVFTGYGKNIELDTLKTLKYDLGLNASTSRNVNFNNQVQYASRTTALSPRLELRFTWKDVFEIRPNYEVSFTKNTFNIDRGDQRFLRHELRLRTTTMVPKNVEWQNDIRYITNPNVAQGFTNSSVFWNSAINYSVFDDAALVTFKVYDLLNQNTNARRTATQDYIQDVQSTVLQRYFMLSFTYKFNSLGKKGEIRENNWWND